MFGAPECLTAFGAHIFLVLPQHNRSENTVLESVEHMLIQHGVAKPRKNFGICINFLYLL
jgi:hypothetical protein